MLTKEVLKKIRTIHLHAKFFVKEAVMGEYQSSFKGQGMEFTEVREYEPGDDVRTIDWNVSARMNSTFVKKFREERELTVILLVDVSSSGNFGTSEQFKREIATEIAAAIAYLAIQNNDKVGLVLFSDHIEKCIVPQKGRNHVLRIIREVLTHEPKGTGTDLKGALEFLNKVTHRKSAVFFISDFYATGYNKQLKIMAKKHDLVAISIRDKFEDKLPQIGFVNIYDPETGECEIVNTGSLAFRTQYENSMQLFRENLNNEFKKAKVDHVPIQTHSSYIEPLINFFKQHARS